MKYIALAAFLALIIAGGTFVSTTLAATYYYVNTHGSVSSVNAQNASAALAAAPDIAPHSGVAVDMGVMGTSSGSQSSGSSGNSTGALHTYFYVDASGFTTSVVAPDPQTAFALAANIAEHSGVALGEGNLHAGMKVASVK